MTSWSSELKNLRVLEKRVTVGLGISCIVRVELIALEEIVIKPRR